jgi:hypothetical protein
MCQIGHSHNSIWIGVGDKRIEINRRDSLALGPAYFPNKLRRFMATVDDGGLAGVPAVTASA